jgi:hypothetical protein
VSQPQQAPTELDPDAQLDLLDHELERRRAARKAEAKREAAAGGPCAYCGAVESWKRPGEGHWLHGPEGPVCHACDLDRRRWQRPDGSLLADPEHRAYVIAELLGPERARRIWPPFLLADAPTRLRWWHETPGAPPGQGPERFGYVDRAALAAGFIAPPPEAQPLHRGPGKCPACGCKGACWRRSERPVAGVPREHGEGYAVGRRPYVEVTWTCWGKHHDGACRHTVVEQIVS